LVLIAALLAIVDGGPGPVSLDALRRKSRRGFPAMLGALGVGAAASTIAVELGRRGTQREIDLASYESSREPENAQDGIAPAPLPTEAPLPKKTANPSVPPTTA
jgi:hypothetical protein